MSAGKENRGRVGAASGAEKKRLDMIKTEDQIRLTHDSITRPTDFCKGSRVSSTLRYFMRLGWRKGAFDNITCKKFIDIALSSIRPPGIKAFNLWVN